MNHNNINENGLTVDISDELSRNLTIHSNVNQEIIITTSDKIEIVLIKTKEILISRRDWWTPFGLFISFITTLTTADFKNSFGIAKEFWKAIFVLLTLISFIWFIHSIIKLIKNWGKDSLEKIIAQIKVNNENNLLNNNTNN